MNAPNWRERFGYWFDNWMSRGTVAIMVLLGAATVCFVFIVAALVQVFRAFPGGTRDGDFWDVTWGNLMRTLDPGTMGGDTGWGYRLLMLVVTIGGLIIVASLIGIVSGAFDDKMAQLRKGRSRVLEKDHTLVLGWGATRFSIISEICTANESRRRSAIVVLADKDKVEMEDEVRAHVPHRGKTAIICRRGNPRSPADLDVVSPQSARSVIVLPPLDSEDPDIAAIHVVLALSNGTTPENPGPRIVAELRDAHNLEAARLVGHGRVDWLLASEIISRITVQTGRQRGLSVVYLELLDFSGDEIYFTHQPQLTGATYFDAQLHFVDSTVIGILREGQVQLNPTSNLVIEAHDRLIVIAEDDSAIHPALPGNPEAAAISRAGTAAPGPEHTLILGCNSSLQAIVTELGQYSAAGSTVRIVADVPAPTLCVPDGLEMEFLCQDATRRSVLDSLDVAGYDHAIVLPYRELLDPEAADAKTLVSLLHLRDIADAAGSELNIVTEMLSDRNRQLAQSNRPDDFIVSERLVGLMLSQISESGDLAAVFDELFSSAGVEIYLRPAEAYISAGHEVDFYTVSAAAALRGETAIGFRTATEAYSPSNYGVHLNPNKAERVSFAQGDMIIVLADSESAARVASPSRALHSSAR